MAALVLLAGPTVFAQDPGWSVDPGAYQSTMTVTGALVVDGRRSTGAADLVAAFAGEELRGVAAPTEVGGMMTFFLTVYANAGGEEITFKAYLPETGRVLDAFETLRFTANAVHGTVSDPFVWNVSPLGGCTRGRPGWTINPAGFQSSMSVTARASIVTGNQPGPEDLLAAFAGEELRGVAAPVPVSEGWLFFLTIYANTGGEALSFRFYEAATDAVYTVSDMLTFEANAVVGAPNSPLPLTAACPATTTAAEPHTGLPGHGLRAHGVYPNPFHDTATITYTLDASSDVEINVYDARGRAVRRWTGSAREPGTHHVRFDAGDLPSGVYVYRIRAGASSEAGRMTRIR